MQAYKGSFISHQSNISSKKNIFKMMLKQDKDEDNDNVDLDEIDKIQDNEMNFEDEKMNKSFGNSDESLST